MATVKGTAKVDKFTVNASSVIVVTGKKSSTKKISKNGKNRIYGAAAKDTFTVKGGKLNYIYGDAGNDTITVTSKIGSGNRIYGDDAKDKVSGNDTFNINVGSKNYFYGGKGVDTFNVNGGTTNYIYGGAGNDVIVIGKTSTGTAVVKDFSVKSGNKDTVKVTGGAVKSIAVSGKNMIVKGGKSTSVTLQNAKAKTFTVTDTLGSYTVSGANVKLALGKNYKGTLNTASFITTVDARSDANAITINGNAKNNTIYGGAGNNILNGGVGNDTLAGGAGKDTFVYANGQGNDTISDYVAGQDTLQISSGSISKAVLANSNKDLVFTVGSGSITLKNAAAKAISLKDSRGSYTASKTDITLNSDFTGKMDAGKYLSTVTTVNGKSTTKTVTVIGNTKDNIISGGSGYDRLYGYEGNDKLYGYGDNDYMYGGDGNDYLYGGTGNDALYGGAGKDTFVYANGDGSDAVKDYKAGSDTLYISSGSISKTALANSNEDLVFTVGSGSITLQNAATKAISLKDSRGSYTASSTAITLGKDFRGTMDAAIFLSTVETIDGSNAVNSVNITGNAQDNIIYAGKGGGTLNGGEGKDIFHCGDGISTINDFTEEDFIHTYRIFNTKVENDDVLLTVGFLSEYDEEEKTGTILLRNAADKVIHLAADFDGHLGKDYLAVSNTSIIAGKDFYMGDINANAYFSTIVTIDARAGEEVGTIIGNDQDNIIYAAKAGFGEYYMVYGGNGNDTIYDGGGEYGGKLYGGDGDDTLYGSGEYGGKLYGGDGDDTLYSGGGTFEELYGEYGNDTFIFTSTFTGYTTIMDYQVGEDIIAFKDNVSISYGSATGDDVDLSLSTGGTIYIAGAAGKEITFDFNNDGNKTYQTFT